MTIEDPWHWLRDPKYPEVDDPDVLAYLKAENAYFEGWKAQHQALIDELFEEMKGRIKEDDSSVPLRDGDFLYWWAFKPGAQYRTWYRKPVGGGADEVIFDEPVEAEGNEYFRLGALEVSPDGKLLATLVDYDGSERFELRIRDLATRQGHRDGHQGRHRPAGVDQRQRRHRLHRGQRQLAQLPRALPPARRRRRTKTSRSTRRPRSLASRVGLGKSQDKSLIFVSTGDNATSEVRFVSADDPSQPLTLISRRKPNREYHVDAAHGKLWIHTNDDHVNFRLAEPTSPSPDEWRTVIAGSDRVYLTGVTSYRDHLAISSRVDGLDQLVLRTYAGEETRIPFAEASYSAFFIGNPEFAPDSYRLGYSSMVTPMTTYDYHPESGELEVRKVQEIPSGYDASQYATERLMIDGARRGEGAGVGRLPRRASRRTARASCSSTPMALTATRSRRCSTPTGSACSTAAGPARSRISAAATISATMVSRRQARPSGPTRSTISSMSRRGWSRRSSRGRAGSRSTAARRAAS